MTITSLVVELNLPTGITLDTLPSWIARYEHHHGVDVEARLKLTLSGPTFARMEVSAAANFDAAAKTNPQYHAYANFLFIAQQDKESITILT